MAAGKSTVGRELAARLEARFVDLDREIEDRAGARVAEIFARDGEARFRRLEREALARLAAAADVPLVVATGGGTMTSAANRRLMAASGLTVWLDADFEVLSDRLTSAAAAERPLFRDRRQARRLLELRRPAYRRADLRLRIGAGETAGEVAARILDQLERRGGADDESCGT